MTRFRIVILAILVSATLYGMFISIGLDYFDGYILELGSIHMPKPGHIYFLFFWTLLGTPAAIFLGFAFAQLFTGTRFAQAIFRVWNGTSDRNWLIGAALLAFVIPCSIRSLILHDGPVTDDETAYLFMARLLSEGKLYVTSPPMKVFFDHPFMTNNGQFFAAYFIGWPILLIPGIWAENTGLMNPFYSALHVITAFLVLRRLFGSNWAKLGSVLLLTSPMLVIAAATELSHTTCLMALTMMIWCFLASRDEQPWWWTHAGVALFFSLSFFIRPYTAVAAGTPLLFWWLGTALVLPTKQRRIAFTAFCVAACVPAILFLMVNKVQNGSCFKTAYASTIDDLNNEDNYVQITRRHAAALANADADAGERAQEGSLTHRSLLSYCLANAGIGLVRFNASLFGWPISLAFLIFAGTDTKIRLFWWSFLFFIVITMLYWESGIDTFAPLKYTELSFVALVLTIAGIKNLTQWLADVENIRNVDVRLAACPVALVIALITLNLAGYLPARLRTLHRASSSIVQPREEAERLSLHQAVVFCPSPFTPQPERERARHFVFWRPNNDPELQNDILWVNNLGPAENTVFMQHFPARRGYLLEWSDTFEPRFVPME